MAMPAVSLLVDMDRDGAYETDWQSYIHDAAESVIHIVRGDMDASGDNQVSELSVDLDDRDGRFNPLYESGSYYGQMADMDWPCLVRATYAGVAYDLWTGYGTSIESHPEAQRATFTAIDLAGYFAESEEVNITASSSRDTDGAIEAVATAMGLVAADLNLDDGVQALPWHFAGGQSGMASIMEAASSEMGGHVWIDASGRLRFESRASRLGYTQFDREVMRYRGKGLEGYWKLTEAGGTVAYDYAGSARNGAYNGSPSLSSRTSPFLALPWTEHCADFDQANDYVSVSDADAWSLGTTGQLSVVALFCVDSLASRQTIAAKYSGATYEWDIDVKTDGKVEANIRDAAAAARATVTSTTTVVVGTWYCVVLTADDSTDTLTLYVAGLSEAVDSTWSGSSSNTAAPLTIGSRGTGPAQLVDGAIARVAVLSVVLTAADAYRLNYAVTGFALGDGLVEPCEMPSVTLGPENRLTKVSARGASWAEGLAGEVIFNWYLTGTGFPSRLDLSSVISIPAGGKWTFEISIPPAITSITTPASSTDYLGNTAADGTGTDRTSSLTLTVTSIGAGRATLTILNGHASDTVYITRLQLRGTPLVMVGGQAEVVIGESIPNVKAGRQGNFDVPFVSDGGSQMRDFAAQMLYTYRYDYPRVKAKFAWNTAAAIQQMLMVELGDLVYLLDRGDGGNGAWSSYAKDLFYVEGIEHEIVPGGMWWTTLALIPAYVYRNLDRIWWDDFGRANVVGDLGVSRSDDTWADDAGLDISSSAAIPNTNSACVPSIDLGAPGFDQAVRVYLSAMSGNAAVGVSFRKVDTSNYLRAYVDRSANKLKVEKVVATVSTSLATYDWTAAATAEILVIAQGERIRVWLDRVLRIDTTSNVFNYATKTGFYALNANGIATFDNAYSQALV